MVEGKQLEFQANPIFLGITYDRLLSFLPQAQMAASKLARGSQVLSLLAGAKFEAAGPKVKAPKAKLEAP